MAGNKYFKRAKAFSFKDIVAQYAEIRRRYENVHMSSNKGKIEIYIQLQPTETSQSYTIKITATVWKPNVNVFVVKPDISKYARSNSIPHTYPDGSLCLYLPKNSEWDYYDSWAETLVPWASLWLYYFEIWLMTGEWLGGGVHPGDVKSKNDEKTSY